MWLTRNDTGWLIVSAIENPNEEQWDKALYAIGLDGKTKVDFDYYIEDGMHVWEIKVD